MYSKTQGDSTHLDGRMLCIIPCAIITGLTSFPFSLGPCMLVMTNILLTHHRCRKQARLAVPDVLRTHYWRRKQARLEHKPSAAPADFAETLSAVLTALRAVSPAPKPLVGTIRSPTTEASVLQLHSSSRWAANMLRCSGVKAVLTACTHTERCEL